MPARALCFLFVSGVTAASAGACGSDPATDGASADAGDSSTVAADGAHPATDGSDEAAADGASPLDSGADAATTIVPPSPPAGTTKCGQGTLEPKDIVDACKLPVSFGPPPVVACDDVTSDGGRYEVWCSETSTYVWVELDAVRPAATTPTCPVAQTFVIGNANYSYSTTNSAGAGGANLPAQAPLKKPYSFSVSATIGAAAEGTATIWLTGVDGGCPFDASFHGALVAGARVSWP